MSTRCPSRQERDRDAVLASILPAPGEGLPALEEVDLSRFWTEFEASAPLHLRLGLRAAGVSIGALLPRLLGYRRGLAELDAEAREAVIVRASQLPGFSDLVEVAKVVACLAYFNDPAVQAAGRSRA